MDFTLCSWESDESGSKSISAKGLGTRRGSTKWVSPSALGKVTSQPANRFQPRVSAQEGDPPNGVQPLLSAQEGEAKLRIWEK
ncbi:Uncharacterized protein TCM_025154 [Theobroma cacao]|uniref:Uncharacterized protein n=1 Tax=Theobroma cacao TaxID=3641 RepID=A0A061EYA9_THECC|nr:Uncharacterized protein TCM_025154 [Theobroma cacao]